MRERRAARERRRAQEFEAFVGGAGGRLLRAAVLLTGETGAPDGPDRAGEQPSRGGEPGGHEAAERLLTAALAGTYAAWDRLRGEDPYERTRRELVARFARSARHHRRPRGGVLARLTPRERLVLVLRLHEGIAEEQTAASLGLPVERVRTICTRAVATLRARPGPGAR
ncbi:sigma factor-like helix-turn-helix DNA-binding protein [Streptomyces sp. ISL-11]|uniref:sigma factor-like helix-turn-helix DNA-binding protein n=1 Tax=Streptomyces sp. ISL-11 TaxID=2819174 RepID=UPI001BE613A4|nr:sigma factor-like helix-turn-helix DNA-binding protein [Streptomyces sp. ISL-11]MBT2386959.1 RNA polymerase [Streptomyces sp. ISL-11]